MKISDNRKSETRYFITIRIHRMLGGGAGFQSMPAELTGGVANLTGSAWPCFSPFIGEIGAFVASPQIVVALQATCGAAGNVICAHNHAAASAFFGP